MRQYGKIIREARELRGLSQAELADIVGVQATQVSRWERNQSPPTFDSAVRLSSALGRSLEELAGLLPLGVDLNGGWRAAWQTWRGGEQVVNEHGLTARHHGDHATFQADGDYDWFGDCRLTWQLLKIDYRATEFGGAATGTMMLALTADRQTALGTWSGITGEGKLGSGYGVVSRTRSGASDLLKRMIHDPGSVTEWPLELAATQRISE